MGPVSGIEINILIRSRQLDGQTLVWHQGLDGWQPLGEFDEFREAVGDLPPPITPQTMVPPTFTAAMAANPWPRLWARLIDIVIGAVVLGFSIGFVLSCFFGSEFARKIIGFSPALFNAAMLPLTGIALAFCATACGNTPGKALLGLKARSLAGRDQLSFYLLREMKVWLIGFALGIPIISLFTQVFQYVRVRKGKSASYDENMAFVQGKPSLLRTAVGAFIGIILLLLTATQYEKPTSNGYILQSRGVAGAEVPTVNVRGS